eukprot:7860044-Alexandrium_andersonii.AAC.1
MDFRWPSNTPQPPVEDKASSKALKIGWRWPGIHNALGNKYASGESRNCTSPRFRERSVARVACASPARMLGTSAKWDSTDESDTTVQMLSRMAAWSLRESPVSRSKL